MEIRSTSLTVKVYQGVQDVGFDVPDTYGKDESLICKAFSRTTEFDRDGKSIEHYSGRGVKRLKSGGEGAGARVIYSLKRKHIPADILAVLDVGVAEQVKSLGLTYTPPASA